MKNKVILFVNYDVGKPAERVVHRALAASGSEVHICNDAAIAERYVSEKKPDLILYNYDDDTGVARAGAKKFFQAVVGTPMVLVSQKKDKEHLIELFSHEGIRNLVARNGDVSEEELIITTEKLLRKDVFGPEKYLTWGVHFVQEVVEDSAHKAEHIKNVSNFVKGLRCDTRFERLVEIVTDELLMNALYDAPVGPDGKALYAHLPRTERVHLDARDRAVLEYGSDGRYVAIACRDRFGALRAETVVSYLRKCFVQDEYQVDTKQGGAGVGFYMIFQSINQLVINIQPGRMTETIGLIDIRTSYRDTKMRSKSFNIFVKGG